MFIRKIEGNTMRMMIRWFPSQKDPSIYITHHRIYARKGPPLTMGEILQKKRRKAMLSNSVNDATKLASSIGNRMRKSSEPKTNKIPSLDTSQVCSPKTSPRETAEPKEVIVVTPIQQTPVALWKSLILPVSAILLSIILTIMITRI